MNTVVVILTGLFFLSFFLTYIIKRLANRLNVVDIPNERSSHIIPTPRGGGLAIVITWYLGISVFYYFNLIENQLYFSLLCGALLAVISLVDDVVNLPPFFRLISQFITVLAAFIFLKGLEPVQLAGFEIGYNYILYPVTIIGMVWFINLYNFLDGIDGYVSIEAILVSVILFIFSGNSILLVLIACVLGFLIWNWPKAKIFMGDVGSTQLGFILVVLGIYFHNQQKFSILQWLILTSPFWFDATLTLFRRWRNKEKLSQAHKKHAYQRIVQSGYSHLKTDLWLIMINLFIFLLIYVSDSFDYLILPVLFITVILLYILTKQVDKKMPFN
ncbi:MAG TPA: glycosyltransferase family 4 protein [Bacteroidales bacterium]|nr:glycosyltransferase family 4 protein [Bacteroidales bacterium]